MDQFLKPWTPRVLSLLRIVSAFLFMQHGGQKLLGFPAPQRHAFDLLSLSGVAGVLELFGAANGPFEVTLEFTRPAAFLLSGLMAFAYFIAHAPRNFWPLINHGELAALFCFVFLYLAFAGGGSWSLDRLLTRRR